MKPDSAFWARVDASGECWLWTGAKSSKGYGTLRRQGKHFYAHRYAMMLAGTLLDDLSVDHVCHNKSCVRPAHLRAVTNKQNHENLRGAYQNSASGVRGVWWDRGAKSWHATVGHNGKQHRKRFPTLDEASAWVQAKRLELFTHNDVDQASA